MAPSERFEILLSRRKRPPPSSPVASSVIVVAADGDASFDRAVPELLKPLSAKAVTGLKRYVGEETNSLGSKGKTVPRASRTLSAASSSLEGKGNAALDK